MSGVNISMVHCVSSTEAEIKDSKVDDHPFSCSPPEEGPFVGLVFRVEEEDDDRRRSDDADTAADDGYSVDDVEGGATVTVDW